ncbi:Organic cation transporter 1 [Halotydeus destructor]|nr:Organic cation transporter 1 [Halotydeus destructor]
MDFESILKSVGEYGTYQKRLVFFYMVPTTTIFAFYCMNTFFMLSVPDAWCDVPAVRHLDVTLQHKLSRPPSLTSPGKLDSCSFYDIDYSAALAAVDNATDLEKFTLGLQNATTRGCSSWVYDKANYDATAVTDLNLVCDQGHWVSLILTLHGIGEVIGNPVFGVLADRFGRKSVFFAILVVALSSSTSPIFFKGLYMFAILRFVSSATAASLFNLPYIIITELVGPEYRSRLIGIGASTWTLGMCLLPVLAYYTRHWVIIAIVPTVLVLPMFLYWNIIPESPRWLLSVGRYEEAYDVMAKIARVNGKPVPAQLMEQLRMVGQTEKTQSSNDEQSSGSILDILRSPALRTRFILITFSWMANVTAYRGITLNFQNFEGSEFVNWFLLAVVEFPSNLGSWYLMDTVLGRRWSNSLTMSVGGLSLCLPLIMPAHWPHGVIVASLIGKCLCNMAYNVVYQQTMELFPTPVRNQGMSYSTAIAAGANFGLPYLAATGKSHVWLPLLVMGSVCLMAGIAASFLPETLDKNLPQTLQDGENFGRGQAYLSLARRSLPVKKDVYSKVNLELN